MTWNVRGLNRREKRIAVRQAILLEKPQLITLQETKLGPLDDTLLREICGRRFSTFEELPAQGTRGGILLAWNSHNYTKVRTEIKEYLITVYLKHNQEATVLAFTAVYGPTN